MFIIVSQERLPWGLELPRHLPNICPIWSNMSIIFLTIQLFQEDYNPGGKVNKIIDIKWGKKKQTSFVS